PSHLHHEFPFATSSRPASRHAQRSGLLLRLLRTTRSDVCSSTGAFFEYHCKGRGRVTSRSLPSLTASTCSPTQHSQPAHLSSPFSLLHSRTITSHRFSNPSCCISQVEAQNKV
ncbi:hypothetical protein K458DRAFT_426845, partial [Lentithecium fluviatile CBS 122367]